VGENEIILVFYFTCNYGLTTTTTTMTSHWDDC